MRQLTGFLALTLAVAYLTGRPPWYRIVIVLSALPIALSANIARVILTGYIMHFVNPQFALGTYHTIEGLLMMGFGLLLLHSECWILDQICSIAHRGASKGAQAPDSAGGPAGGRRVVNESDQQGRCKDARVLNRVVLCGCDPGRAASVAEAGLEKLNRTERPAACDPAGNDSARARRLGRHDEPVDSEIVDRSQTTEYLNRIYESREAARGSACDSGSTIPRQGRQPAPHARDLPASGAGTRLNRRPGESSYRWMRPVDGDHPAGISAR